VGGGVALIARLPHDQVEGISTTLGTGLMLLAILFFLALASWKKVNAWDSFTEGAKDGFKTAIQLVPFMVGILVAVGVFRASGGMQVLVDGIAVGTATATSRPDVCAVFPGRPGCPNVGFSYSLNTAALASGPHTIAAAATDSASPPDTGSTTITVQK